MNTLFIIGIIGAVYVAGLITGIVISKPVKTKKDIDWVNDDMAQ